MKETDIIITLSKWARQIEQKVYNNYQQKTQNCIAFGDLVKIAATKSLSKTEREHLSQCSLCQKNLHGLQLVTTGTILRSQLPAAAGTTEGPGNISSDLLASCGFSTGTTIICERRQEGYAMRIDSSVPMALVLVFAKDEEELYRIEINEEIPDQEDLVPPELIADWTEIRILRKA